MSQNDKKCLFYLDYYHWKLLFRDRNYFIKSNICYKNVYKSEDNIDSRNFITFVVTPLDSQKYNNTINYNKRITLMHEIKNYFKEHDISIQLPIAVKAKFIGYGWIEIKKVKNLQKK